MTRKLSWRIVINVLRDNYLRITIISLCALFFFVALSFILTKINIEMPLGMNNVDTLALETYKIELMNYETKYQETLERIEELEAAEKESYIYSIDYHNVAIFKRTLQFDFNDGVMNSEVWSTDVIEFTNQDIFISKVLNNFNFPYTNHSYVRGIIAVESNESANTLGISVKYHTVEQAEEITNAVSKVVNDYIIENYGDGISAIVIYELSDYVFDPTLQEYKNILLNAIKSEKERLIELQATISTNKDMINVIKEANNNIKGVSTLKQTVIGGLLGFAFTMVISSSLLIINYLQSDFIVDIDDIAYFFNSFVLGEIPIDELSSSVIRKVWGKKTNKESNIKLLQENIELYCAKDAVGFFTDQDVKIYEELKGTIGGNFFFCANPITDVDAVSILNKVDKTIIVIELAVSKRSAIKNIIRKITHNNKALVGFIVL